MTRNLLRYVLLGCFASLMLGNTAYAQQDYPDEDSSQYYQYYRASKSLYFKGRLGGNFYGGDRDINPDNEIQKYIENIGFSLGLEAGYAFSDRFSLGLMHLSGVYPRIKDDADKDGNPYERPAYGVIDAANTSTWRHHFSLIARSYILPRARFSPYGQLGFNVSLGTINDKLRTGIGPIAGIGFDVAVSDRVGIFLELDGIFVFDDADLDLADTRARNLVPGGGSIDASDFDAFTFLGVGVRFTLKSPIVPVTVDCTGPERLKPGEEGTFTARFDERVTRPITFRWDFGDNTPPITFQWPGRDLLTTHAFAQPGTYTATLTATNRGGTDTALCSVEVLEPPECRIEAVPPTLSMCTQPLPPVQFRSTVTGTPPIGYQWDFDDGTTSTEAEPTHTYTRLDAEPTTQTNTVTLRVRNEAGAAVCTTEVKIEPCPCVEDLQLAQVFFDRNESILKPQDLQNLRDNVQILRDSPSTLVFVQGFATANERNAEALAEDRARVVAQFYTDNGIAASRVQTASTVLDARPKSGVPPTVSIPYCSPETLQQRRTQIQEQVLQDLRQQQQ